jgi:hypothetical protein
MNEIHRTENMLVAMNETARTAEPTKKMKTTMYQTTNTQKNRKPSPVTSSTVRDFDHLKFMNETIIKDEVLGKFIERCGDLETSLGKETMAQIKRSAKPAIQEPPMSIREQLREAMQANPNRFYSNMNFQQLLGQARDGYVKQN